MLPKPEETITSSNPVFLTVIIPIFNDWESALENIKGIAEQALDRGSTEIILVDNGSSHIPDIKSLPKGVTLIHCEKPGSYAARNAAIRQAQGEILAFTDADCLPDQNWLAAASEWFSLHGNGATILAGGVKMFLEETASPTPYALYDLALGIPQARYVQNGYAVTANLFVPRSVFDRVGLFDEQRFSGGDAEFCRRAGKAGIPVAYLEAARVYHPARSSWTQLSQKTRRVKGGQLLNGSPGFRLQHGIRTLLPPLRAWLYALRSPDLLPQQKALVCMVQARLWVTELTEMWRLLVLRREPHR